MELKHTCKVLVLLFAVIMALAIVPFSASTTSAATEYTVSVSTSTAEGGTVEIWTNVSHGTSGTFSENTNIKISATPADGWRFVRWMENDSVAVVDDVPLVGTTWAETQFSVSENRNFVAEFASNSCTLSLVASPAEGGTVKIADDTTSGTFEHSSVQNIYATPNYGYKFVGWYKDSTRIAESPNTTYHLLENTELVAKFEKIHDFTVELTLPEAPGSILDLSSIVAPASVEYEVNSIYDLDVNGTSMYLDDLYGVALLPGDEVEIKIHANLVSNEDFQCTVPAKVNGKDATYVDIRSGNLEITYEFTVVDTPIELTLPEAPGSTLDASAISVPAGAFYSVDSIDQLRINNTQTFLDGVPAAALLPGDVVTITIDVKLTSGEAFHKPVSAKVNGKDITDAYTVSPVLLVSYSFTVANTPIELTLPEAPGSTLDASAISVPAGAFYSVDRIYQLKVNGSDSAIGTEWGAVLEYGDEVDITIHVDLTSGESFSKAVPTKVNGTDATIDTRAGSLEVTYSFKVPDELVFNDSDDFDFAEGLVSTAIDEMDVSYAVSGGVSPYTFSKVSGPAWISVSADGTISGTRPASIEATSELVVKVTDSASTEKSITIAVGATVVPTKEDTPSAVAFTATGHDTGKLTDVAPGMTYRIDTGEEIPITGTSVELEDLEACTIYVIKKATGPTKLDSDPKAITITVGATPAATFTATGDRTGTLSDVSSSMAYRFGTGEWVQITGTAVDLTDLVPTTISIVLRASGTVLQSAPQVIEITKAYVPSGVTAEKCTASTNDDGKLKGVTTSMEYRLSTADSWTSGTGSDLTVPAGTYHVRVKVSGTALASDHVSVIVNEHDATPLTGTVSIDGNAVFDGVLTVLLSDTNNTGTLSYRWVREGGTVVGISDEYTVVKEDIGKTITVYVVSSKQTGELSQSTGTVSKAPRSDVPTGLDTVRTTHGQSEGRITGVDDSMEYRFSTADSWTAIDDTEVTGLAIGTYHVRFAMNDTHLAGSEHATVIISEITYTVSFGLYGHGDDISAINDVEYGSKVVRPADPSETGYNFGGWFKEAGCENAWDFDTDVVTSDVTLYAKWTLITYAVSFSPNGGTGTMEAVEAVGDYVLPANVFTAPTEMEFKCWSVGGVEKNVGDTMEVTEPVTVVAVWKEVIHDEPLYEPSPEGEEPANTVKIGSNQTTTVTEVFDDSKTDNKKVVLEIDDMNIEFDAAAVSAIGGNTVTINAVVKTEGHGIDGALKVIQVKLTGATFPDGKVTVSIPFTDSVPEGKVVKVYYIDDDNRVDMNAVVSEGHLVFQTNHFSDFAVFIEDAPAPNDSGDDGGFPVWAIALIVVAVIAVAGGVGGYFFLQKKKV